jgi:hypothetical protein
MPDTMTAKHPANDKGGSPEKETRLTIITVPLQEEARPHPDWLLDDAACWTVGAHGAVWLGAFVNELPKNSIPPLFEAYC